MTHSITNYAAEFAQDLKKALLTGRVKDSVGLRRIANGVTDAEHFIMPDSGRILEDNLKGIAGSKIRLPYPNITLEYYAPQDDIKPGQYSVPKRVLWASETTEGIQCVAGGKGQISTFWEPHPVGCIVPYEWSDTSNINLLVGHDTGKIQIAMTPFIITSEHKEMINNHALRKGIGVMDMVKLSIEDICDEVTALLELIEALTCSNVHAASPSKTKTGMNRQWCRKNKIPFFKTKVLVIDTNKQAPGAGKPTGGHASPRQHLRRGHIRRHPSAGNIWINSTVVGSPTDGHTDKLYKVK
tara:strand:- start:3451 stop:4344 length:894 start_codon:yes stop_codon:yes gene_type:complete